MRPAALRAAAKGPESATPRGRSTALLGVLTLTNFGRMERLTIDGVPVGAALVADGWPVDPTTSEGSCIVVIATDAPLLPHQLGRLARRAGLGLARAGLDRWPRLRRDLRRDLDRGPEPAREQPSRRHDPPVRRRPRSVPRGGRRGDRRGRRRRAVRGRYGRRARRPRGRRTAGRPDARAARRRGPARGTMRRMAATDERQPARPRRPPGRSGRHPGGRLGRPGEHLHDRRPGAGEPAPPRGHRPGSGRPAAGRRCRRPLRGGPGRPAWRRDHPALRGGDGRIRPRSAGARPRRGLGCGRPRARVRDPPRSRPTGRRRRAGQPAWPCPPSIGSTPTGPPGSSCWP